jgi:hypothetical protein
LEDGEETQGGKDFEDEDQADGTGASVLIILLFFWVWHFGLEAMLKSCVFVESTRSTVLADRRARGGEESLGGHRDLTP